MFQTNVVKFGKFAICLEKEQLLYYSNGELMRVKDVDYEFTNKDLFDLASSISEKKGYGLVEFTTKDVILKKA